MKSLLRAAAVGALILAGTAGASGVAMAQTVPASADAAFRATTLNLSAYGEVRQAPDMATITLGVTTEAASAAEAMRLNAERMTQVIASLKKGKEVVFTSINFQRAPNPIKMSLQGFTGVFDGPAMEQSKLEERQRLLQEEMQKKAEEARKKLEDAQNAAKAQ